MANLLPENLEHATIASMTTGDVAYTLPWAMWADTARRCWLHPDYSVEEQQAFGTSEMRIELRVDGFHVWAPPGKAWSSQAGPAYTDSAGAEYLTVPSCTSTEQLADGTLCVP